MGAFKHRKAVSFEISLCSDPHLDGHESWVLYTEKKYTERILFKVQAAKMGRLRRVYGVTLRDDVHQWRIKGGADWATARGPQDLGGPKSLSR